MPVQPWNINTKSGYAGDIYGLEFTNSQRMTYLADVAGEISFGYGVTSTDGIHASAGADANGYITGVVLRSLNMEQALRPGDGSIFFGEDVAMSVLQEGYVQIDCSGATAGADVYIKADGTFTMTSTGNTKVQNATVFREADEYGLAVIWVENMLGKAKATD